MFLVSAGAGSLQRGMVLIIVAVVVGLALVGGAVAWVMSGPKQQPDRAAEACWSQLATLLGLEYDPGGMLKGPKMTGTLGGYPVTIDTYHRDVGGRKALFTRFTLDGGENLPEGMDKQSKAKGDDDPVKRILAQATRRHIADLIKKVGATLGGGKLKWSREGGVWQPDGMATVIKGLVHKAEFLCLDENDQAGKLLHGSRDATLPEAQREEMKRLLLENFAGTFESDSVARDLLDDADPKNRLQAAKTLGPKGIPALGKLARDPDVPKDLREQAIAEIIRHHQPEEADPHIQKMLRSKHPDVSQTALTSIRRMKYTPAMKTLQTLATDPTTPGELASAVVEVIGAIGDATCQPVLLGLLHHDYLVVRRRAAAALGRVGTVAAIPQIEAVAQAPNVNKRFKELCDRALDEIRARNGLARVEVETEPEAEAG
ncbi:MAG: HEAT repeat domain-containing protein [bacterium]